MAEVELERFIILMVTFFSVAMLPLVNRAYRRY